MRGLTALLLMAGSLTALLGAGRTWLAVQVQDPVLGGIEAQITGSSVTGAVTAAGLLGAAAGLVSVLTRGAARRVGLVLALAAGGWLVWIGARVVLDPVAAARAADLTGAAGRPGPAPISGSVPGAGTIIAAELSAWPAIVALTGLLMVGGVVTGLMPERRTTAPRTPSAATTDGSAGDPAQEIARPTPQEPQEQEQERRRVAEAWDELSAGHDPTADAQPNPTDDAPPDETGPRRAQPPDS